SALYRRRRAAGQATGAGRVGAVPALSAPDTDRPPSETRHHSGEPIMTTPELALQALAPSNALVRDRTGVPSVLVRIPQFRICDVIEGGSEAIHPAFIVNGRPIPEIWVSKFQNVVRGGLAYSLPDQPPAVH